MFSAIGSSQVLLGLVAMVTDSEGLYAAVKLLTLAVNRDTALRKDMERQGYDVLALLLHRKANITSTHVLQLVVSLIYPLTSLTHCIYPLTSSSHFIYPLTSSSHFIYPLISSSHFIYPLISSSHFIYPLTF